MEQPNLSQIIMDRDSTSQGQPFAKCDQMARLLIQSLAIYNNESLSNSVKFFQSTLNIVHYLVNT